MIKVFLFLSIVAFSGTVLAQNLLNTRMWKLSPRKKSLYVDSGVFSHSGASRKTTLNAIRHAYNKSLGYERIVFDFNSDNVPNIYGMISKQNNKLYLDLKNTAIHSNIDSFGNSRFVSKIDFFPITPDVLPVELKLKNSSSYDVFYLKNPGRLVIDIKNL